MKVKIGITKTDWEDKHQNYVRWIKGSGAEVEVVTLSKDAPAEMENCDGFVLSGGVDVHPRYYSGNHQYPNSPETFNEDRDDFEFSILEKAMQKKVPVLGICRGLQLINVFCQGTLIQDMGDQNDVHTDDDEGDETHKVAVEPGTLLHNIVKENSGLVNSAHHQSIESLGDNLIANSYSEDGVIEGIEWKEKEGRPFMLAVQWHPERMDKANIADSAFSKNLRDHFISRVKSNPVK